MSVKVGVISDSHGVIRPEIIDGIRDCDYILHAGDLTNDYVLDQIRFLARIYVVRGNNDFRLRDILKEYQSFEIEGVTFGMAHQIRSIGHDFADKDIIITGHTHCYSEEYRNGRLYLNPGSCNYPRGGNELTYAIITINNGVYSVEKKSIPR